MAEEVVRESWSVLDHDGVWEVATVWQRIREAQRVRRLRAETSAAAERMARGRQLQAARRRGKEHVFCDR